MTGFLATDREAFLVYLYFGSGKDNLDLCIDRAYLDMCRTLTGLTAQFDDPKKLCLKQEASRALNVAVREVAKPTSLADAQAEFDKWHERTCQALQGIYAEHGYGRFSVGQAQKWVNMTFKYIFTLGESRLPGFSNLFALCHVPLDNIILNALVLHGFPKGVTAWSRMDNYGEYLALQRRIREHKPFVGRTPLDVEFELFMGKSQDSSSPPFELGPEQ